MYKFLLLQIILFSGLKINAQKNDFKNINFEKADNIALKNKGKKINNLYLLTHNLVTDLKTDVEKFRAIYKWVSSNIENDYENNIIIEKKRRKIGSDSLRFLKWNNEFSKKVFKKIVKEKKTICTGYSFLIREMANMANLECEIIDGYGRTANSNIGKQTVPNHSWNAVKLNSKWYLCDATWSSGNYNIDDGLFIFDFSDGYFLSNPDLFIKDHYPLQQKWILKEAKPSLYEFSNGPLIYKETHSFEIIPISPTTMNFSIIKNTEAVFVIKSYKPIEYSDLVIELVNGQKKLICPLKLIPLKNGLYEIRCTFNSLGNYDMHLKIKNENVLSYVVKVLKNNF